MAGPTGQHALAYTRRTMPPLITTGPYGAVFWLVFLWATGRSSE
jgi:hypothetical protein